MLQYNYSGLGCLLNFLIIALLLGAVGLGWVVNGILILFALLFILPLIGWFGFNWWLKRNLVQDQCPVCTHQFAALNGTESRCPNCGEPLRVESGHFHRLTPPGTIDVEAVEVSAKSLE